MKISSARNALLISSLMFACGVDAETTKLETFSDPRPMAKAVEAMVSKYSYAISYEDPRYENEDDLEDVSASVRRDLGKYRGAGPPKLLIPKSGSLAVELSPADGPAAVRSTLEKIVQTKVSRGGHFKVIESAGMLHVVPAELRDNNGNWIAVDSILSAPISIPNRSWTAKELLAAICAAVSITIDQSSPVGLTFVSDEGGIGPAVEPMYTFTATNEIARDVLVRALASTGQTKRAWFLLYDAGQRTYFLNLFNVPEADSPPSSVAIKSSVQPTSLLPPCTATSSDYTKCRPGSK